MGQKNLHIFLLLKSVKYKKCKVQNLKSDSDTKILHILKAGFLKLIKNESNSKNVVA